LPIVVIAGALGWVLVHGLASNLVYYKTPTEIARQGSSIVGERVRMGGVVEPCSVQTFAHSIRFVMTDGRTQMPVVTSAGVPADFRGGSGAVAEGSYGSDHVFRADDVLVKHDDSYTPPANVTIPSACGG